MLTAPSKIWMCPPDTAMNGNPMFTSAPYPAGRKFLWNVFFRAVLLRDGEDILRHWRFVKRCRPPVCAAKPGVTWWCNAIDIANLRGQSCMLIIDSIDFNALTDNYKSSTLFVFDWNSKRALSLNSTGSIFFLCNFHVATGRLSSAVLAVTQLRE